MTEERMTEEQARAIAKSIGMEHNLAALEEFGLAILKAYRMLSAAGRRHP